MQNDPKFKLGSVTGGVDFSGFNFSAHFPTISVEHVLGKLNGMSAGLKDSTDQMVKEGHRNQLTQAVLASGGVITARESELIEKAVNGAITQKDEKELISRFPSECFANQTRLDVMTVVELVKLMAQPLSPCNAAAAVKLRALASVDGYVSTEFNALLNYARLSGGLTEVQQARLIQLLQPENAL